MCVSHCDALKDHISISNCPQMEEKQNVVNPGETEYLHCEKTLFEKQAVSRQCHLACMAMDNHKPCLGQFPILPLELREVPDHSSLTDRPRVLASTFKFQLFPISDCHSQYPPPSRAQRHRLCLWCCPLTWGGALLALEMLVTFLPSVTYRDMASALFFQGILSSLHPGEDTHLLWDPVGPEVTAPP